MRYELIKDWPSKRHGKTIGKGAFPGADLFTTWSIVTNAPVTFPPSTVSISKGKIVLPPSRVNGVIPCP